MGLNPLREENRPTAIQLVDFFEPCLSVCRQLKQKPDAGVPDRATRDGDEGPCLRRRNQGVMLPARGRDRAKTQKAVR